MILVFAQIHSEKRYDKTCGKVLQRGSLFYVRSIHQNVISISAVFNLTTHFVGDEINWEFYINMDILPIGISVINLYSLLLVFLFYSFYTVLIRHSLLAYTAIKQPH